MSQLVDRAIALITAIDERCDDPTIPGEIRELMVDAKELIIDMDRTWRHYRRSTELAARTLTKVRISDNVRPE